MVQIFKQQETGAEIRTEMIDNEPWFVAKDICDSLEYADTEVALRKLESDEKLIRKIFASGQNRDMWMVNESGLYNLIFRSNKPESRKFRKWVTSEVLPEIRRSGSYHSSAIHYRPQSNQELGLTFQNLAFRELLKVESSRVRNRLASLIDFYVSQIM
mgnify:FL=1